MIPKPPKPVWLAIVGASFALNAAFLDYHARAGTFHRVLIQMDLAEPSSERSRYQAEMEARYRKLAGPPGSVVFAGDCLIYQGPWSEFDPRARNRGIPDETSALLLGRIGDVLSEKPRVLVLLTGANDLNRRVPVTQLVRNGRAILERVKAENPETRVVWIGMLPVDPSQPGSRALYDNAAVAEANRLLGALTAEFPPARFLDLSARLADESGRLRPEFTTDGLHLTLDGYLTIREAVGSAVDDADADPSPDPR
jgi:lysophospholipase L1-like esterase